MLGLGVRIQRLLRAPSRCSLRIRCSSSISPLPHHQVPVFEDHECGDYLPWLRQKAGAEISSVLSVGNSVHGRSLFASKPILAGDCIMKVPFSVQLAPDGLHPSINSMLKKDLLDVTKLALVILFHQGLGQSSEWAPFISSLPRVEDMHSTLFWSDEELNMIKISPLYGVTLKHKALIEKQFSSIKHVLDHFPEYFKDVTLLEFMHAVNLVQSRACTSERGVSMIPFADFFNSDPHSQTVFFRDDSKQASMYIAGQNYAPGDEVILRRYNDFCNGLLLLSYGCVIPHNKRDQVLVKVNPLQLQHDHLLALKFDYLDKYTTPSLKDINDTNGFTLMEVESSCGMGIGIDPALRELARVLSCTSAQELQELACEAEEYSGFLANVPLKNRQREVEAHQLLYSTFDHLIENYKADLESLTHDSSEKSKQRVKLAREVLIGELRVLESASAWLKNYCEWVKNHCDI